MPLGMTTSFSGGRPADFVRESGDRLADADVPVDQPVGEAIGPEGPTASPLGDADARRPRGHPGPACRDACRQIGVEQEALDHVGTLLAEQLRQAAEDGEGLPASRRPEEMHVDPGGFQRRQARRIPLGGRPSA